MESQLYHSLKQTTKDSRFNQTLQGIGYLVFPITAQPLYTLLKTDQPDPTEWMMRKVINGLKSALAQALTFDRPNYTSPFFLLSMKTEETPPSISTQSHGNQNRHIGYYCQN